MLCAAYPGSVQERVSLLVLLVLLVPASAEGRQKKCGKCGKKVRKKESVCTDLPPLIGFTEWGKLGLDMVWRALTIF